MNRIVAVARYAVREFGPLIVFLVVSAKFGAKPAIALSILAIVADSLWRWRSKERFTRLYLLTSGLTLAFGGVDLFAANPFMLKYEAVVTNVVTGAAFVLGIFGEKPMLQELAEQRSETPIPTTPATRRFFQLFTGLWAFYFFAKAALYLWLGWVLPMTEAIALRSLIGSISLGVMVAISATQGRRLFFLCRRLGLLPPPEEASPAQLERRPA